MPTGTRSAFRQEAVREGGAQRTGSAAGRLPSWFIVSRIFLYIQHQFQFNMFSLVAMCGVGLGPGRESRECRLVLQPIAPMGLSPTCRARVAWASGVHGSGCQEPGCTTSRGLGTAGAGGFTAGTLPWDRKAAEARARRGMRREALAWSLLAISLRPSSFAGSAHGRPLRSEPMSLNLTVVKDSRLAFHEIEPCLPFPATWIPMSLGRCPHSAGHSQSC